MSDVKDLDSYKKDWSEYLKVQRRYSDNTLQAYSHDLNDFLKFLTNHFGRQINLKDLRQLKHTDFRAWFSERKCHKISARSNVRALSSVRSFFNYLSEHDLADMKIINGIKRPKLASLLPKPIDENQIAEFLNLEYFFENDEKWITDRDRALYTLLYCTGLRINEALNIKTKDIASEIKISGKGKKDRIIILLPIALNMIKTYISSCPYDLSDNFLFIGVRGKKLHASYVDNRLQILRYKYNLPDHATAHAFRHSFATHLVKNGADLRSVQDLLGHESLASTQIYTDVDNLSLLRIFEKSHPLEK